MHRLELCAYINADVMQCITWNDYITSSESSLDRMWQLSVRLIPTSTVLRINDSPIPLLLVYSGIW
jgi:hypothetical protein